MKVYIAGQISGTDDYLERFARAEAELTAKGYVVLNPAALPEGMSKEDYMSICLPMLLCADAVYMLCGWQFSSGALIEVQLARYCGKNVIYEEKEDKADAE